MSKHRKADRDIPPGDDQPGHSRPWRRYWRVAKTGLQIAAAQVIAWALRKWWG